MRAAIAGQFNIIAATVAPADASRLLLRPLVALLRDGCPPVREALLPGLAETLQVITQTAGTLCIAEQNRRWPSSCSAGPALAEQDKMHC